MKHVFYRYIFFVCPIHLTNSVNETDGSKL